MSNGPLYALGGAHPAALRNDAMRGLATGNRDGKAAEREQTILTPWEIVEVCLATWPSGIALDPCTAAGSLVPAARTYNILRGENGLELPWHDGSYINMPYNDLEAWLDKSTVESVCGISRLLDPMFEGAPGAFEQILLFPVRPNRAWWCEYMSTVPTVVSWLKPLRFEGYESGFPAPLVLVYTGANTEAFREAVAPLSTFVGGRLA